MKLVSPGSPEYVAILWRRWRRSRESMEDAASLYEAAYKALSFEERERFLALAIQELDVNEGRRQRCKGIDES